ncbi:PHP domain-containing protein [Brenneria izadpanahii]|uniref:PHP domain-containing protein n=1 Tax=Brenneria izadpanahii TaxID=2722756 RepID=A0ABX7UTS1_9GAMM|nr:PHP domain-containing protein [Brenneria izadpanahii]QTF08695.1 PHP domain-containing protein [Brenneria izadpanahii]
MKKIDLHIHSNYSDDADFPVKDIVERCVAKGINIISITDHNSINSVNDVKEFSDNRITAIPGIEVDCVFQDKNFHLLGYGFDNHFSDFELIEKNFFKLQINLIPVKLEKLRNLGFFIDEEQLYQLAMGRIPQEEQMAELILQDERNNDNELLTPYRDGGKRSNMPLINFYWDFFGYGKPCYVDASYPPLERIVEIIKSNNGIPIIAHIGANIKSNYEQVLDDMLSVGVMGVEAFSSYHSEELSSLLYNYACSTDIFVSCGSDFHGKNKPEIEIGSCCYNNEQYQKIRELTEIILTDL